MDAKNRKMRVAVGVTGLFGFLAAAYAVPQVVGALLMLFSFLVFVVAVTGLIWPPLMRLPNRMTGVWAFAVSVGMFVGGAVLIGPQNGESTASDAQVAVNRPGRMSNPETPEEREARIQRSMGAGRLERQRRGQAAADRRPQTRSPASVARTAPERRDPCSFTTTEMGRMTQTQIDRIWDACVEQRGGSAQVDADAGISGSTQNMEEVYAATWTDGPWPLTIDEGVISCVMVDMPLGTLPVAVIADGNGTIWALNGIAKTYVPILGGRSEIRPIWRDDPRYPGTEIKIDIGPLIQRALRLC